MVIENSPLPSLIVPRLVPEMVILAPLIACRVSLFSTVPLNNIRLFWAGSIVLKQIKRINEEMENFFINIPFPAKIIQNPGELKSNRCTFLHGRYKWLLAGCLFIKW
jgi:hypothetical protein